jgi:hypothetical protein
MVKTKRFILSQKMQPKASNKKFRPEIAMQSSFSAIMQLNAAMHGCGTD